MNTNKRSHQREQLILAMLQQPSIEKAAAAAGISSVTAWRISKTEAFQREYRQARQDAFGQAIARLQQASSPAVTTLVRMMADAQNPAPSRVRAADRILHHAHRGTDWEDLAARVESLELQAKLQRQGQCQVDDQRVRPADRVKTNARNPKRDSSAQ